MAKRKIIQIDDGKCTGCGQCIPNCPEGAIQVIDGKARLVSDLFCDGLGACIGHCPVGAITIEVRDAEPYDEEKVISRIAIQGDNVVRAHLAHLKEHGEAGYLRRAVSFLEKNRLNVPAGFQSVGGQGFCRCPGSREMKLDSREEGYIDKDKQPSRLSHWPVQLHLISPESPAYKGKEVLLCADCVAYAMGDFHKDILAGKSLAIACPKLDTAQDIYSEKIVQLMETAEIKSLTVAIMQVPCCMGLLHLALEARDASEKKIPLKSLIISVKGDILEEKWIEK